MKPLSPSSPPTLPSTHQFSLLFNVEVPVPALQRGWLHSRELTQAWDITRITERIGEACWFSHYHRDDRQTDPDELKLTPYAIAGFWPSGGFIELQMRNANPLDEHPRGLLAVYAESPALAESLMTELLTQYRHAPAVGGSQARIGMLNYSYGNLAVERIPVTREQTVRREDIHLYYGDDMSPWVDRWIQTLNTRRYGLTVLTGDPGTGKTSLLRSLAHWLADTHIFYFMPASRFSSVESGEIVTFWAGENRDSKHRKVLILEDAESIMLRRGDDNREKVATLLNLTDGMLGDALGLHVVCTLNSELADLDPALLRPGRLIAHRDFPLLTANEARRLAEKLGLPEPRDERTALAELFNPTNASTLSAPVRRRVMGFHAESKIQT